MRRFAGPRLPKHLLDQVTDGRVAKRSHPHTRKHRRKHGRTQQKPAQPPPRVQAKDVTPRRKRKQKALPRPPSATEASGEEDEEEGVEDEDKAEAEAESDGESEADDGRVRARVVSKPAKAEWDDEDEEIARLEKKLGINKGSKRVGGTELDWLALVGGGLSDDEDAELARGKRAAPDDDDDDDDDDDHGARRASRKRAAPEDDDWLKQKRRKASTTAPAVQAAVESSGDEELANPFSADEISDGDLEGEEDDEELRPPKTRENPYVAPVSSSAPAKYLPPSLRKAATCDGERWKQLRRQMQGQLNRLSESNMISIISAIQGIYAENARQHCTSVLVELLRERVCDPSDPGDNALILFAGCATALYRVIGTDFAAQLLERLVDSFDAHSRDETAGKQTLNILSFLANLYILQAIGCAIIFEYTKLLLDNFSEANTVLLLRVVRIAGQQLRQDDPSALKDIVLLLQRSVAASGGIENVSQRARVMIDFIHDLKNNRVKASRGSEATAQAHMQRMKKTLGTMKNAKTTEPLRIGLADIRDSEKKGKWWLVGASWRNPAKMVDRGPLTEPATAEQSTAEAGAQDGGGGDDSEADIDLAALAKAQGMNTDVRKAIFISIAGAVDPQHAHLRIMKLHLKNKQMLELPRVIMHCVGAEPVYNHFYTLVATKFCSDHRMRKAWQFSLLDVLRRCGEDAEDGADEADRADGLSIRQVYNMAQMYATLIADGLLRISVLKPLPFAAPQPKSQIFAEVLLTTLFVSLRKRHGPEQFGRAVEETFGAAHLVPDMVHGLTYFVETVMSDSDAPVNEKERTVVTAGCEYASSALNDEATLAHGKPVGSDEDSEAEGSVTVDWN